MQQKLVERLAELRKEFDAGQARLRDLEMQTGMLREKVLRISGAILVLEELLAAEGNSETAERAAASGERA